MIDEAAPRQARYNLAGQRWLAVAYIAAAAIFVAAAILSTGWFVKTEELLALGFVLLLLGLAGAMAYEAAAIWFSDARRLPTISSLAHVAYRRHRTTWLVLHMATLFAAGGLTMHFTRLVGPAFASALSQPRASAQWWLIAWALVLLVGGAVSAYFANLFP